jgi:hypothetical protein
MIHDYEVDNVVVSSLTSLLSHVLLSQFGFIVYLG